MNISIRTVDETNEELISTFLREALRKISSENINEKEDVAESPRVPSSSSQKKSSSKKKRHLDNDNGDEQEEVKKHKQQCECCTIQKPPFQLNNAILSPKKMHSSPKKKWINPAFTIVNNREVLKLPPSSKTVTSDELRESIVVGQFAKKFIVLITRDKHMMIVDQHAADERIILEDLEKSYLEKPSTGRKAVNLEMKLDRDEYIALCDFRDIIVRSGFEWEEIGLLHIKLTRVPDSLTNDVLKEFKSFLHELAENGGGPPVALPPSLRRAFAKKSCRPAIMFGDRLTLKECTIIVKSLSECKLPFFCAHGRPTCVPLGAINEN